ncbi:MAG: LPS export ABC transporter ATP-binding protein [Bdellovibrionota bacterium]
MHKLSAENLVKIYNNRKVVNDVSININGGEVVGLLGPNGAGKTTSFYMCVGLIGPDVGRVFLDNEDITKDPMYLRAHKGIGYLPQEASIFRKLTVGENLMAILETIPFPSQKARKDRMQELLEEFGVSALENNLASSLSGGERRRVEIARTLTKSPHFILLDEPFAGIDPLAIADIQEIIKALCHKGIGVLITDHNVRETLGICDRAYILVDGQILEEGTPKEIATSKKAQRYYLGDNFSL